MIRTTILTIFVLTVFSGCWCSTPEPEVRYVDRNITVNIPVPCVKDANCTYKGNDIEVIAGMHTCILNYKEQVKRCKSVNNSK